MSKKKEFKVIVMSVIAFLLGFGGLIVSYTVLELYKYAIIYLSILNMIWLPLTLAVKLFILPRKHNKKIKVKIEEYAYIFVPIVCTATMLFLVTLAIIFSIF